MYHAIEQRHSPEWRIYAQLANKRYQGARNFVQKLVCDKITQYIDHFTFLFDDLGNDLLCVNLINMGDCREVLQGIIRYFVKELKAEVAPEDLKRFVINIYSKQGDYNEFSVLSDQKKLREYIVSYGKDVEDVSEMALILSKNIRCYYRNPKESAYQYAHLTFYEMESSEDSSDSRIKIYLHPVEVKIGQNQPVVVSKAKDQVLATYKGLWKALWPDENRDYLECKLSRNFLMQLIIVCCEKMRISILRMRSSFRCM